MLKARQTCAGQDSVEVHLRQQADAGVMTYLRANGFKAYI